MKSDSIVYVKFPKTGLGNLLLVWARARVFAKVNNLHIITSSWWGIRWGAFIRRENKKRLYFGYFIESSFRKKVSIILCKIFKKKCYEPPIEIPTYQSNAIYIFNKIIVNPDLFKDLRKDREFIREELNNIVEPDILKKLKNYSVPSISVHIRRGDFKYGNPITPISFFVNSINLIRDTIGYSLPVTVFSDATTNELSEILSIPNVEIACPKPDILDILLMSKSEIVVLSQSSTFSYWAAFLSNAIIIKPWEDWQNNLRDEEDNKKYFEGKISFNENKGIEELISFLSINKLKKII